VLDLQDPVAEVKRYSPTASDAQFGSVFATSILGRQPTLRLRGAACSKRGVEVGEDTGQRAPIDCLGPEGFANPGLDPRRGSYGQAFADFLGPGDGNSLGCLRGNGLVTQTNGLTYCGRLRERSDHAGR